MLPYYSNFYRLNFKSFQIMNYPCTFQYSILIYQHVKKNIKNSKLNVDA